MELTHLKEYVEDFRKDLGRHQYGGATRHHVSTLAWYVDQILEYLIAREHAEATSGASLPDSTGSSC